MAKDISMKELREHLADVADHVEHGETFRVIRRSKPAFIIMNIGDTVPEPEGEWETFIDFTDGGKELGVRLDTALKALRKMNR